MKNLKQFTFKVRTTDVILVMPPVPEDARLIALTENAKKQSLQERNNDEPLIVVFVGEEAKELGLKRGDYVYVKRYFSDVANLLELDKKRRWNNPLICTENEILAVVLDKLPYEKRYDELMDKIEIKITKENEFKQLEIDKRHKH